MTTRSFALDFEFAHPPAKVWRALTDPALLSKWLMSNDFTTGIGEKFNFKANIEPSAFWDGIVHCEMLEAEPHKRLKYTWRGGPLDTVVTWTLAPTASGGTKLTLEQSGFPDNNQHAFGGAKLGWERNLGAPFNDVLKGID